MRLITNKLWPKDDITACIDEQSKGVTLNQSRKQPKKFVDFSRTKDFETLQLVGPRDGRYQNFDADAISIYHDIYNRMDFYVNVSNTQLFA